MAKSPTSTEPTRPMLAPSDVARRLGLSLNTVKRYIADGTLPSIKYGSAKNSATRVDPDVLDQWLADRDAWAKAQSRARLAGGLSRVLTRRDHLARLSRPNTKVRPKAEKEAST